MDDAKERVAQIFRVIIFFIITILICNRIAGFLKPVWMSWNNYDTVNGFYMEPENTIEAIFLGASITANGITPMELYEDYGICAYNLGMEQQPLLASYYWTREACRFHSETLKTIVLDVSILRRTPEEAFFQKSLDGLKPSNIKWQALMDYTGDCNKAISMFFPLFEYHSRWDSLEKTDFEKGEYEPNVSSRGYNFEQSRYLNNTKYESLRLPQYIIKNDWSYAKFNNNSLYYLGKLIEFCDEKELKLLLIKTPGYANWGEAAHNSVSQIASYYGLEFLDFNYDTYLSEIGFNEALDTTDGGHMNYYGARKLTAWIGNYLTKNSLVKNIRGEYKYAFMDDEYADYKAYITPVLKYRKSVTLEDYLSNIYWREDCITFLVVKGDAAKDMTDEQRWWYASVGLKVY